jgi:hypothetical protein
MTDLRPDRGSVAGQGYDLSEDAESGILRDFLTNPQIWSPFR